MWPRMCWVGQSILSNINEQRLIYTVMGFPIFIVWKVRIDLKKKIILFGIFSLVSLTIAVTIVRGSILGKAYKTHDAHKGREINVTWIWFWFFIEYSLCKFSNFSQPFRRLTLCSILHRISCFIPSSFHSEREESMRKSGTVAGTSKFRSEETVIPEGRWISMESKTGPR